MHGARFRDAILRCRVFAMRGITVAPADASHRVGKEADRRPGGMVRMAAAPLFPALPEGRAQRSPPHQASVEGAGKSHGGLTDNGPERADKTATAKLHQSSAPGAETRER